MNVQPEPQRTPGRAQSGSSGDVLEPRAAVVAIEHVSAVVSEEQIQPSVVVVVAGAHAGRPPGAAQPDPIGHVRERAVAPVAIQPIGRRLAGAKRRVAPLAVSEASAAQHERVEPAVAVVVDERDTGAVGLDDEPLSIDAAVDRRMT